MPVDVHAGRRPAQRRPGGRGRASEAVALGIPADRAVSLHRPASCAPTTGARPSTRTTSSAAPRAPSARPGLDIGVLLDVALDPYTSHGHDGLMRGGEIVNDETLARARAPGAGAGRGRLRHHRALRHDGRPRRRHPHGARGGRPPERADHGLCRQVRVGVLRAVPRRGRLIGDADRRQAHLPDGPRQLATRRCARWRSTSPRAPTW